MRDAAGKVRQRFDYYPFGTVSGAWSLTGIPDGIDDEGPEVPGEPVPDPTEPIIAEPGSMAAPLRSPRDSFEVADPGLEIWIDDDPVPAVPPQSVLRYRFGGKEIAGQKVGASVPQNGTPGAPAGTPAAAAGRPYLDFGARLYDPRTAAWLSQDPMAEKYYGITPYAYCAGDPVNLVDPDGMWIYIYDGGTQYRFFEGILQKYAGLDDNGEEIFEDYTPDLGSFLANILSALNRVSSTSTGSQLLDYYHGTDNNAYIYQSKDKRNVIDLGLKSTPIYLNPEARGSIIPEEGGLRESPFWLDVAHELAHRQDGIIHGTEIIQRPWLTDGKGTIIPQTELYATHVENRIREEAGIPLRTHYALVECSDPRFSVVYEPSRLISTSGESLYFPGQSYIPFILRFP